jgi:hypothetical protein
MKTIWSKKCKHRDQTPVNVKLSKHGPLHTFSYQSECDQCHERLPKDDVFIAIFFEVLPGEFALIDTRGWIGGEAGNQEAQRLLGRASLPDGPWELACDPRTCTANHPHTGA